MLDCLILYVDLTLIQRLSNHPVHIIAEDGSLNPSAMIPFCELGNMSITGVRLEQFSLPVCQAFKRKILNDQLCYEIDLNEYKQYYTTEIFKKGFSFVVDLNDNRKSSMISTSQDYQDSGEDNLGMSFDIISSKICTVNHS